jgi:hypothetical protein
VAKVETFVEVTMKMSLAEARAVRDELAKVDLKSPAAPIYSALAAALYDVREVSAF